MKARNHYLPKRLYVSSRLEFQLDLCLHMNFSSLENRLICRLSDVSRYLFFTLLFLSCSMTKHRA